MFSPQQLEQRRQNNINQIKQLLNKPFEYGTFPGGARDLGEFFVMMTAYGIDVAANSLLESDTFYKRIQKARSEYHSHSKFYLFANRIFGRSRWNLLKQYTNKLFAKYGKSGELGRLTSNIKNIGNKNNADVTKMMNTNENLITAKANILNNIKNLKNRDKLLYVKIKALQGDAFLEYVVKSFHDYINRKVNNPVGHGELVEFYKYTFALYFIICNKNYTQREMYNIIAKRSSQVFNQARTSLGQ